MNSFEAGFQDKAKEELDIPFTLHEIGTPDMVYKKPYIWPRQLYYERTQFNSYAIRSKMKHRLLRSDLLN
ncbi:MAG: hypothetical protein A3G09_03245 [Candidatus Moranbacteria bacterium RIFCSPLOWO2_12_FULL_48_12]|nr:MAG: hypothetical protein A3G09_03245 [Candidatus Moranbacteria bacterium RIFCSPLOWO2_12_FULL_48_12]